LVDTDESVDRITAVTRQLLLFGRKQSGDASAEVKLEDVVPLAVKMVAPQTPKGVRIVQEINGEVVRANPQDLFQVILNIVHNALQAVDPQRGEVRIAPARARFPEESFFAAGLRPFRAMNTSQRRAFVFRETCFHLSNLLVGERSGEQLVAQVLVLTARDQPWHREFLAVMAQEEAKHFLALQRYLSEKAGVLYPACRQLRSALSAVENCASPEVKLLVGQVVFEWTAASLVATLLTKSREPLLAAVLRVNLKDEARHLAYSQELREPLAQALAGRVPREMEDLVFESVRASVAA